MIALWVAQATAEFAPAAHRGPRLRSKQRRRADCAKSASRTRSASEQARECHKVANSLALSYTVLYIERVMKNTTKKPTCVICGRVNKANHNIICALKPNARRREWERRQKEAQS